ncbi:MULTISPECIES: hypothetical protein, partial [unclassified Gilliamella]|uniref:hypothetical protein n=1 Tax=unclassified Gilliamella TaxID=2685620 RepID=UPI001EEF91A0
ILNGLTKGKTEFTYDSFGSLAAACYQDGSYDYKLPDEVGNLGSATLIHTTFLRGKVNLSQLKKEQI